jgi:hypothetical protein
MEGVGKKGDLPVRLEKYSSFAWRRVSPVRFLVEKRPGFVSVLVSIMAENSETA